VSRFSTSPSMPARKLTVNSGLTVASRCVEGHGDT
jgi:hypothetical protein